MPNRYVTPHTSKVAYASYKFSIHSVMFRWKIFIWAMRKRKTKKPKREASVTTWVLIYFFHWNKLKGIQMNICICTSQRQPWSLLLSCRHSIRNDLQSKSWKSELWALSLLLTLVQVSGLITRSHFMERGQVARESWRKKAAKNIMNGVLIHSVSIS